MGERRVRNAKVGGSIPPGSTKSFLVPSCTLDRSLAAPHRPGCGMLTNPAFARFTSLIRGTRRERLTKFDRLRVERVGHAEWSPRPTAKSPTLSPPAINKPVSS